MGPVAGGPNVDAGWEGKTKTSAMQGSRKKESRKGAQKKAQDNARAKEIYSLEGRGRIKGKGLGVAGEEGCCGIFIVKGVRLRHRGVKTAKGRKTPDASRTRKTKENRGEKKAQLQKKRGAGWRC